MAICNGVHGKWIRCFDILVFHMLDDTCEPLYSERYGGRKFYHIPFTKWRVRFPFENKSLVRPRVKWYLKIWRNIKCMHRYHDFKTDEEDINGCRWRFCRNCGTRQNNMTGKWRFF